MFRQSAVLVCTVLPAMVASSIAPPPVVVLQSSSNATTDPLIPQAGPHANSGSDTVHECH